MMSWIELDGAALADNVARLRKVAGTCELCLVVKANAYGHGMAQVVPELSRAGVGWLAVQTVEEVQTVRATGYTGKILLLGPFNIPDLPVLVQEQVRVSLRSTVQALEVQRWAETAGKTVMVHLEVDVGMHRYGLSLPELIECAGVLTAPAVVVEGLFGHYPASDVMSSAEVMKRWEAAYQLLPELACYHVRKSEALSQPSLRGETMVRVGLGLYGVEQLGTKPVLSWHTQIQQVHEVQQGETIGYDRRYMADRPMRIGVLPVGYAEGVPFSFTNQGFAQHIDGSLLPIRGSVCMNASMVEISPEHRVGDEVLLAPLAQNQALEGVSRYELLTRLHPGIQRRVC